MVLLASWLLAAMVAQLAVRVLPSAAPVGPTASMTVWRADRWEWRLACRLRVLRSAV